MSDTRVRFSPAPTGMLHVGNARTALFNWLYARHTGGTFILRIEDTDVTRSTAENVTQIQDVLRWLGLDWDDGPHLQSHRFDTYLEAADRMIEAGQAYYCYCSEAEVRERNDAAIKEGRPPGYDGRCRDLTDAQRAAFEAEGRPRSVRFRTPDDGCSSFVDLVRGDVSVEWSTISDFVIVRSNHTPVFFLANAVDDIDMAITHVLRGEDLIDSTHRVLALRHALGHGDQPVYAHLPLILGVGGGKLSKRHGAINVEEYRDSGYLPDALVNYLALLGWGPDDGAEVMSREELITHFTLERVVQSAATFDPQKLEWLNAEHIRRLDVAELAATVLPFASGRYGDRLDVLTFEAATALARERATTLTQIADQAEFLFVTDDAFEVDQESWEKTSAVENAAAMLDSVITHIEKCDWTPEAIDPRPVLTGFGKKAVKPGMQLLYTATHGRRAGLPWFDSVHLLGRDTTLRRLRTARQHLETG